MVKGRCVMKGIAAMHTVLSDFRFYHRTPCTAPSLPPFCPSCLPPFPSFARFLPAHVVSGFTLFTQLLVLSFLPFWLPSCCPFTTACLSGAGDNPWPPGPQASFQTHFCTLCPGLLSWGGSQQLKSASVLEAQEVQTPPEGVLSLPSGFQN